MKLPDSFPLLDAFQVDRQKLRRIGAHIRSQIVCLVELAGKF